MSLPKNLNIGEQSYTIRFGKKEDVPAVHRLVRELAILEKAEEELEITAEEMAEFGFGKQPLFEMLVIETADKEIIGAAVYYIGYSTWKGPFFYLEDLIITERFRRMGLGKELLDSLILVAKAKKAFRMGWQVLDWNEAAIAFYKAIGASLHPEWINCRFTKAQLDAYQAGDLMK